MIFVASCVFLGKLNRKKVMVDKRKQQNYDTRVKNDE